MNGCIIEKLTEALTEALSVPVKDFNRIFLKCEGSIGALKKKRYHCWNGIEPEIVKSI